MKSFVLNIPSSVERLALFKQDFPQSLEMPEVWRAKTPEECDKPAWWRGSDEFWSHTSNMIDVLTYIKEQADDVLFFEDDCIFASDFDNKWDAFMKEVPHDYDVINLCTLHVGSQFYTPQQLSENVLRAKMWFNTNALLISPKGAQKMLTQLQKPNWMCKHICERQLGYLVLDPEFIAYAPIQNFIGQRGCYSELCKRYRGERWYNNFTYIGLDGKPHQSENLYQPE